MVANGDTDVNVVRAEHAAAVAVTEGLAEKMPPSRSQDATPVKRSDLPARVEPKSLRRPASAFVSVFVQLATDEVNQQRTPTELPFLTAVKGSLATAELELADALRLQESDEVRFVELGQPLQMPRPLVLADRVAAPSSSQRRIGDGRLHRFGADVLVGLIDVQGFDFAHPDFLDAQGKTRFLRIWDQGGNTRSTPADRHTAPFNYGAELMASELNAAIAASRQRSGLAATTLEPQSQMAPGSHGTHVASIAAGNLGVCRAGGIVAVLVSVPEDELERRRSFYDSSRLAHAVDYLLAVADELRRPIAINISLGTNGHAHDDSAPVTRWIDASLTRPGRSVCVAAGNAGQERSESEGDVGWIMGRVHAEARVAARELVSDVEWLVVGNGVADISENELEIWYGPQDRFSVQVRPPDGQWSKRVQPGEYIENRQLPDGSFLSVYNELYHPANGANLIAIYLSPLLSDAGVVGVSAGEWLVRLHGEDVRDGRYQAWIERDDPRRVGRIGEREAWVFPSFFSEASYIDRSTISSLACGQRLIGVANLDANARRISISSSQGPTRDGREKPDIAAPGTGIVAAKGFSDPGDPWIAMSGTSMASPFVTGVCGLMLGVNPTLTAAQIGGILRRTARPLPGADFRWRDDAGAGEIDPERCLQEAEAMRIRRDVT
jgi:subtilisin family serine protease